MQTRTSDLTFPEDLQEDQMTHTCRLTPPLMTILHPRQADCLYADSLCADLLLTLQLGVALVLSIWTATFVFVSERWQYSVRDTMEQTLTSISADTSTSLTGMRPGDVE